MVDPIFRKDIVLLAQTKASPCVSFYVPTSPASQGSGEERLHLKNGVGEAENLLIQGGMRPTLAKDFVEPVRDLIDDHEFWIRQGQGLAVFLFNGERKVYRLQMHVEPLVTVGTTPHIRPLLPLLEADATFHVLAIERNGVRLIRCTAFDAHEVTVPDLPRNMLEALDEEAPEKSNQMHMAGSGAGGPGGARGGAIQHGSGDRNDDKSRTMRYCQIIDKAVTKYLNGSGSWLVVAADAPIADTFHNVSHYAKLADGFVPGSPKVAVPAQLREQAESLLKPEFGGARQRALEEFAFKNGTGFASNMPDEIVREAGYGRIHTLLVSTDDFLWGTRAEDGTVKTDDAPDGMNEDLLNIAAVDTLANGGDVFTALADELPDTPMAAIYRH